jgi:hypothetical protein
MPAEAPRTEEPKVKAHYISLAISGACAIAWADHYDGPSPCAWLAVAPGQPLPSRAEIRAEAESRTGQPITEVRLNDHLGVGLQAAAIG